MDVLPTIVANADDMRKLPTGFIPLIHEIVDERPTYGYRRVTAVLNRRLREAGRRHVNHNRIYRIMK